MRGRSLPFGYQFNWCSGHKMGIISSSGEVTVFNIRSWKARILISNVWLTESINFHIEVIVFWNLVPLNPRFTTEIIISFCQNLPSCYYSFQQSPEDVVGMLSREHKRFEVSWHDLHRDKSIHLWGVTPIAPWISDNWPICKVYFLGNENICIHLVVYWSRKSPGEARQR